MMPYNGHQLQAAEPPLYFGYRIYCKSTIYFVCGKYFAKTYDSSTYR